MSAAPSPVPGTSPSASAGDDAISFADVFSAYQNLQQGLRPLPNEHRMHCEGSLCMLSQAFTGTTPSREFEEWSRTGYLASTLSDVWTHIDAVNLTYGGPDTVDRTASAPAYLQHAHDAMKTLDVLLESIVWLGHSPIQVPEINRLWMRSSALVYRMDRLPSDIQTDCKESMDKIRESLQTIESFVSSVITFPAPMETWAKAVREVLYSPALETGTKRSGHFMALERARYSVSAIGELLGKLEEIHAVPLPHSVDPEAESPVSEEP